MLASDGFLFPRPALLPAGVLSYYFLVSLSFTLNLPLACCCVNCHHWHLMPQMSRLPDTGWGRKLKVKQRATRCPDKRIWQGVQDQESLYAPPLAVMWWSPKSCLPSLQKHIAHQNAQNQRAISSKVRRTHDTLQCCKQKRACFPACLLFHFLEHDSPLDKLDTRSFFGLLSSLQR